MMLNAILGRITYANVMATGAMFVALSGGAYALRGVPDAGGALHGCVSKRTGALRLVAKASSCHKRKGTRKGGEFAVSWNQQGVPGVTGMPGQNGTPGQSGATNVTVRFGSSTSSNAAAAPCAPGERATGGGGVTSSSPTDYLTASFPLANGTSNVVGKTPDGWEIISNTNGGTHSAYVVCASP